MAKKNTNPEVRFAGFTEEWEEKNFEKVFSNISNNSLSREKLNYVTGLAKNVHYGDILVKFNDVLDVKKVSLPYISDNATIEKLKKSILKDGDIIISDAAEDEIVGKCVELYNVNEEKILSGLHTIAVRPKEKFAPKFLGYYMNSNSYHDQLLRLIQGTKVLSISKTAIKNTFIRHPQSIDEQELIANFHVNIDKLIAEHQQKHSKLQSFKQAMLDKMFPKQGQLVPEIRFKGFEGNWEEINVGSICKTTIGVFVIKTRQNDLSPYPVYNGGVSYTGFYDEYNNEANKIVISARGANAGFVNIVRTKYWAGNSCYSVDVLDKELFDIDFLFYYIKKYQRRFLENQQSANIPSVSKSDVERFKVFYPSKAEQSAIAKYLLSLDNQISNNDLQINKLQNIKKAFLAKMFI